ncbi:MAG: pyridine nucleotide-disulfide oxidoreductase [Dehalococcoidia bacterium]|nr:pyridine nucleotide-disulfide oxidoreductase [Dehalococcoidia bacterium]
MQRHVVVVGAGFAGLNAVRVLARNRQVRVTLVDRSNYHLFFPLLYQVAIAGLEAPQVAYPIRAFLRRYPEVRFIQGQVEAVDLAAKTILVDGAPLVYDSLIVGSGSRTADFGVPGVAEHALGLKSLSEAMTFRDRVLSACEEAARTSDPDRRRALLTFVVVGGGPTGVELAGALAELRQHVIRRDYPELDLAEVRVVLIEAAPRILTHLAEGSSAHAARILIRLGVELHTDTAVESVAPEGIRTKDSGLIASYMTVWAAGVAGAPLPGLPAPERAGRLSTTAQLSLPDHREVYIVGDTNHLEDPATGRAYPQVAPLAVQQGTGAANNILNELRGQQLAPFRYRNKGTMATIGRNQAVAEMGWLRLRGFPAWAAWLGIHLIELIGFRNRMMVLTNWAYSYLTYDYAVRIMHHRAAFPPQHDDR